MSMASTHAGFRGSPGAAKLGLGCLRPRLRRTAQNEWTRNVRRWQRRRADSSYVFTDRIGLLLNEPFWSASNSIARRLFESHLLVVLLYEVKGIGLADLMDEAVNEAAARREMLSWYADQSERTR